MSDEDHAKHETWNAETSAAVILVRNTTYETYTVLRKIS